MVQLSPVPADRLDPALAAFAAGVAHDRLSAAALDRVRATLNHRADETRLLGIVRGLARRFGIPTIDEEPARAFSWDGRALRIVSDSCVLFHEIAHWQLAPPERRAIPDFGLGAGPETGRKDDAERARCVDEDRRIDEETEASLLGILWEARFGGRAIDAFLEQNWLERFDCDGTHRLFSQTAAALHARGLIDHCGLPGLPGLPADPAPRYFQATAALEGPASGIFSVERKPAARHQPSNWAKV